MLVQEAQTAQQAADNAKAAAERQLEQVSTQLGSQQAAHERQLSDERQQLASCRQQLELVEQQLQEMRAQIASQEANFDQQLQAAGLEHEADLQAALSQQATRLQQTHVEDLQSQAAADAAPLRRHEAAMHDLQQQLANATAQIDRMRHQRKQQLWQQDGAPSHVDDATLQEALQRHEEQQRDEHAAELNAQQREYANVMAAMQARADTAMRRERDTHAAQLQSLQAQLQTPARPAASSHFGIANALNVCGNKMECMAGDCRNCSSEADTATIFSGGSTKADAAPAAGEVDGMLTPCGARSNSSCQLLLTPPLSAQSQLNPLYLLDDSASAGSIRKAFCDEASAESGLPPATQDLVANSETEICKIQLRQRLSEMCTQRAALQVCATTFFCSYHLLTVPI